MYRSENGIGIWRPEITPEVLEAAGYKRFTNAPLKGPGYIASFQKRFDDDKGARYFITFTQYDLSHPGADYLSIEADVSFRRNGVYFQVESVQSFNATLDQVERFIGDVWQKLGCDYYERFSADEEMAGEA